MPDTSFRTWMDRLRSDLGPRPEWSILLCWILEEEYRRQRQIHRPYSGRRVLIDRTQANYDVAAGEKRAMYGLCHRCWEESNGRIEINGLPIWLLSYEVPNQSNEGQRRADLVGLTAAGGLVVFEGKLGENKNHPPISAILESLDYLCCLTADVTFERLIAEFHELRQIIPVPEGFEAVKPRLDEPPTVIILADLTYFDFHDRSARSLDWRRMINYGNRAQSFSIRFAQSSLDNDGFFSREIHWLN